MRRRLVGLMAVVLLLLVAVPGPGFAADNDPVRLMLNGRLLAAEPPAQVINGRTLVPIRFVAENLGAKVGWDASGPSVIIENYSQLNPTWR